MSFIDNFRVKQYRWTNDGDAYYAFLGNQIQAVVFSPYAKDVGDELDNKSYIQVVMCYDEYKLTPLRFDCEPPISIDEKAMEKHVEELIVKIKRYIENNSEELLKVALKPYRVPPYVTKHNVLKYAEMYTDLNLEYFNVGDGCIALTRDGRVTKLDNCYLHKIKDDVFLY